MHSSEPRRSVHVWDPREHPEKRQQPEGGAAGRHERPELDAGGRRAGRQHGRPKVSSARVETETRWGLLSGSCDLMGTTLDFNCC